MTEHHPTFPDGHKRATPGCPCDYCRSVYDEWAAQAIGFGNWLNHLVKTGTVEHYFGNENDD
jgi:hypothetical protein